MDYNVALLVFGILLLLVGLVGKVKAKELEIGTSSKVARTVIGLIGALLVALSLAPSLTTITQPPPADDPPISTPPPDDPVGPLNDEPVNTLPASIAGRYLMDKQASRVIVVTHVRGNEYRIEEPTSPWPWVGTAELDGGKLSGEGRFPKSLATMRVDGVLRNDGSIEVDYTFITKGEGSPGAGRIDHHVWYPD
ncbi:MAG: hypothetical protein OEN00_08255 [Gemmatimonadota bacterium]|nr:hypothetical protein [Gemmatimonadota bacterium]